MKNFYFTLAFAITCAAGFSQAGSPASPYYDGFNFNLTGMSLKSALAQQVYFTHQRELTYQEAEDAIKIIDLDPSDPNNVLLLYGFSNNVCPSSTTDDNDHRRRSKFSDGSGSFCQWNREHTYPRSLGVPDLGTTGPGADVHHLRACDVDRNNDRGNEKFTAGSGNSHSVTSSTWYPGDEWKGDVARMMMYMYIRYGTQCLPKNVGTGATVASDSNMISLFLQWNAEDPVSAFEDLRNSYQGNPNNDLAQGNRNPFIDNPYLATLIWGGTPAENRWPFLSTATFTENSYVQIYPNPATGGALYIQTQETVDLIEIYNLSGQLVRKINNPHAQDNVINVSAIAPGFYLFRITSTAAVTVRKVIMN